MIAHLLAKKYRRIRQTRDIVTVIAVEVMREKRNDIRKGLGSGKDLMSLLLRANVKEDKEQRMLDEEIIAGIT